MESELAGGEVFFPSKSDSDWEEKKEKGKERKGDFIGREYYDLNNHSIVALQCIFYKSLVDLLHVLWVEGKEVEKVFNNKDRVEHLLGLTRRKENRLSSIIDIHEDQDSNPFTDICKQAGISVSELPPFSKVLKYCKSNCHFIPF